jgi:serine/threonine protein kinase
LKPANVKVRTDGNVKLLDFGIAKVFAASRSVIELPDVSQPHPALP